MNIIRLFACLASLVLLLAFFGCSDSTINFEPDENPVLVESDFGTSTFGENTIHMTGEVLHETLLKVSDDGTEFTFASGYPITEMLRSGTILVMGISDLTPMGALRKIDRIEIVQDFSGSDQSGNTGIRAFTVATTLEEAFQRLDIASGRQNLEASKIDSIVYRVPSTGVREKMTPSSHPEWFGDSVELTFNHIFATGSSEGEFVRISGSVEQKPAFNLDLGINAYRFRELYLSKWADLSASVSISANFSSTVEGSALIYTYWFAPMEIGPLVILPGINLSVGYDGVVEQHLLVESGLELTDSKAGIRFVNDGWQSVGRFNTGFTSPEYTHQANAQVRARITPGLDMLFFGAPGPHVAMNSYIATSVDTTRIPVLEFTGSIEAEAAMNMDIISLLITSESRSVFDWSSLFYQSAVTPEVTTVLVRTVSEESAITGGEVSNDGGSTVTARGVVWGTSENPTLQSNTGFTMNGEGVGSFSSMMTGLTEGTRYYVRAYATNNAGTGYGNERLYTLLYSGSTLPTVNTGSVNEVRAFSARSSGNVTSSGLTDVIARGLVWDTSPNPTLESATRFTLDGEGAGSYESIVFGLVPETTYYLRAYATNSIGTAYGNDVTFTTTSDTGDGTGRDSETMVVDVLNPVTGRVWMDRNLGATRVAASPSDADAYGNLYQWGRAADGHQNRTSSTRTVLSLASRPNHADFILASDGARDWLSWRSNQLWEGLGGSNNPCPVGYRLPTQAEWNAERDSWSSNNTEGAFGSPLKLTSAGHRNYGTGALFGVGFTGRYWSDSPGWTLRFNADFADSHTYYRAYGFSVRCIKG